jgi:TonB family protein
MARAARLLCGISLTWLALGGACIHRASSKNTRTVPQAHLEPNRLAGSPEIFPDQPDAQDMARRKQGTVAVLELCLGTDGAPQRITIVRSSGYGAYDLKLATAVADWRYKPYQVAGKPAAVCTSVTFIYRPATPARPAGRARR